MFNNIFINEVTWLRIILEKPLKNEYINMCHMFIYAKRKNNYF